MFAKHHNLVLFIIICCFSLTFELSGQEKPSAGFIFHAVEKKETVFSIAKKYSVTPEDIYRYNPSSKEKIKTGEVLQIPKKPAPGKTNKNDIKNNQEFILHKVRKGESLYFIAQKYNCSQEAILKLNSGDPSIKRGTILKIPLPVKAETIVPATPPSKFIDYKISAGDTYYNLKKRYGIEREELEVLNPVLKKQGLNTGLIIRIPKKESEVKPTDDEQYLKTKKEESSFDDETALPAGRDKVYNVGLYLPFCSNLNDSANLSSRTVNYLEFYEGVMIAVNHLSAEGMKIKLYVYDTNQDPKVVERLVKNPEFLSLDLIIGPVYPECQKVISPLSAKNRIPMISPLSSDNRYTPGNPYYFQVNPDRGLRINGTADYVINNLSDKNIIILNRATGNSDSKIVIERLSDKISPAHLRIYNLWSDGPSGIESLLDKENENIIVLTEEDEAKISVAVTRLNTLSKRYNITLVGLQEYTRMQSINIEYLHHLKLHYLAPYYVDYNNLPVIDFITKYRSLYSAEPTQFSYQGYDITTSFLTNLHHLGKKLVTLETMPKVNMLQADYNFRKVSNFGGFVNRNFFIIEYTIDYEVKSSGKIRTAP